MPATQERRVAILRGLLIFSIASTGIHFTHNFVEVDSYPEGAVPNWVVQAAILLSWPLLTAAGLRGYRLYRQGRLGDAHLMLGAYSLLGITTLGHFLDGNPEIPAFFYATIFTDGIAGFAILGFVALSARSQRQEGRALAEAD